MRASKLVTMRTIGGQQKWYILPINKLAKPNTQTTFNCKMIHVIGIFGIIADNLDAIQPTY